MLFTHENFLQMQQTQLCPCIPSIPSHSKITLGELGGEAEDRTNREAKQQGVLSTYDRKGRKHPITLARTNESPEKGKPINRKIILMLLIKT